MGNYMEDVLSQPDEIGQCLEYYEKSGLLEKINQLYGMPFENLFFLVWEAPIFVLSEREYF